jgi:hypothetical protein
LKDKMGIDLECSRHCSPSFSLGIDGQHHPREYAFSQLRILLSRFDHSLL